MAINQRQFRPGSAGASLAYKPKNTGYVLRGLWHYLSSHGAWLFLALVLTIGANLLGLVGPYLSGKAVDAIELGRGKVDFETVFHYALLMVIFYIASSAFSYVLAVLMQWITKKIVRQMRNDVMDKLTRLPVGYFDRNQTGDIISRISYDIDVINTSLSTDVVSILASIVTVVGSLVMMIAISPVLVLVMCVTIPMALFYTRYMAKKTRPLFRLRSAKLGEMNGFSEEAIGGQKTICAYAAETAMLKRFDAVNDAAVTAYYNADYYGSIVGPTVNFINNISLALVTMFGAMLRITQGMPLGSISSFVLYSRKFSGPINEAANIISELQSALAAAERVLTVLDTDEETADRENAVELTDTKGAVELAHVTFGYVEGQEVLKDICLNAKPGSMTAIVGETGSGKTTIINLLMRFYDPQTGEIRIDGIENRDYTRESLRKAYAMVLQDTWLFGGTIYDNIAYGKEGATEEEVVAAAKAAKIHSFIMRLPQGYQTVITEDGSNISKGQKQLLTIARAMLLDAKMLILDEATSNVDTRTEIQIQEAMRKLMAGKTCFVIAHRLSTIRNADEIILIDHGKVIERGNHEELMQKNGAYRSLYHSQFE